MKPEPKTPKEPCSTCIFSKKSPVDKSRVKSLVAEALKKDAPIVCHHTTKLVCKGFDSANPCGTNFQRMAKRLGAWQEVDISGHEDRMFLD